MTRGVAWDQPSIQDMLAPTLATDAQRVVVRSYLTGTLALITLRPPAALGRSELELACSLHAALGRGLLVLV